MTGMLPFNLGAQLFEILRLIMLGRIILEGLLNALALPPPQGFVDVKG